jgi:hypothetical protein
MTSLPARRSAATTGFHWGLYADATFAGLSVLVPIPFLDSAFEWFFKRRVPGAVARWRGRRLEPAVAAELNREKGSWWESCLMLPITLTWGLIKRLSKKVLYFLTIKEATDHLSYQWHRAFLIDYALGSGHLETPESAEVARLALEYALATATTSPLEQLAQRLVPHTRHVTRSLRKARKGEEDEMIAEQRNMMARAWSEFGEYLADVAYRYDRAYHQWKQERAERAAAEAARAAEAAKAAAEQAASPHGHPEPQDTKE